MLASPVMKRHLHRSEDLEEGELPDSPKDVKMPILDHFGDGYDVNYLGNAADRARLASLTELEREIELYKRSDRRENLRNRLGIKYGIMASKEKQTEPGRIMPASSSETQKRRSALDRLMAQRQGKRHKEEECNELELQRTTWSHPDHASASTSKRPKRDINSDLSSEVAGGDKDSRRVTSLMELCKALLTRNQLEALLDKPSFEQSVIGCFVRIAIGYAPAQFATVYRLSLIVAVEQTEQEYQVGGRRTRRVLQLQHGGHRRNFQMHLVSNQAVTPGEFNFWLDACQRDAQPLPTLRGIAQKQRDIQDIKKIDQQALPGQSKSSCSSSFIVATTNNRQKEQAVQPLSNPLPTLRPAAVESQSKPKAPPEPIDVDKLDLFALHNFEIHLDLSKLRE